jgi:hypothetical protein
VHADNKVKYAVRNAVAQKAVSTTKNNFKQDKKDKEHNERFFI